MVEECRLHESKYVEVIYVLSAVGPNGRVGMFLCLKTAALGMNVWT